MIPKHLHPSLHLIHESFIIFRRYPSLLIPLLIIWIVFSGFTLYIKYAADFSIFGATPIWVLVVGAVFFFALLLTMSCFVLLECVEQIESGAQPNLILALKHTVRFNILTALPLVIIWTFLLLLFLFLRALFSRKKKNRENNSESFSVKDAAQTVAGFERFSFSATFISAVNKLVRMIMFLILPAIAWERLGSMASIRRGISIFKSNLVQFTSGYVLIELVMALLILPAAFFGALDKEKILSLPDWAWIAIAIYSGVIWSYTIYLEQLFTANLYLWHKKWEAAVALAQQEGRPLPVLRDIPKPSLLDGINEFA